MNWKTKLKISGPSGSLLSFDGELQAAQKNIIVSVLHGMPDMADSKAYSAMLYALADEMRQKEGCVTESPDLVEEAAERIDYQTVMIRGFEIQREELLASLEAFMFDFGKFDCDEDRLEEFKRIRKQARAAIASVKGCGFDDFRDSCPNYTGFREDHDSDQCTHGKGMEWCEKSDCPRLCLTDTSAKGGAA